MEYRVEEPSPVKRKLLFNVSSEDVDQAIGKAVGEYRATVSLKGFRKGKAPAAVVERLYREPVYDKARQILINASLAEALEKLEAQPCSPLNAHFDGNRLEKGKSLDFSVEFDVFPEFELPDYAGVPVDQEKTLVEDAELDAVLERLRTERAKIVPTDLPGPAIAGQIANINFQAYEDGKKRDDIHAENYDIALNEGRANDEFETLVKAIPVGDEKEGDIHFPEKFAVKDLSGKTLRVRVKVNGIKERQLPPLDDDFAKSLGQENLEDLHEAVRESCVRAREDVNKGRAEKKLLNTLEKDLSFELPDSYVDSNLRILVGDLAAGLEGQGRSLASLGKSSAELEEELLPRAKELARDQILLLAIAKKEGLSVSEQEIFAQIFRESYLHGQDFNALRSQYENSGMIHLLRDRMLADKAMDLIYDKAIVTYVDPPKHDDSAEAEPGSE